MTFFGSSFMKKESCGRSSGIDAQPFPSNFHVYIYEVHLRS